MTTIHSPAALAETITSLKNPDDTSEPATNAHAVDRHAEPNLSETFSKDHVRNPLESSDSVTVVGVDSHEDTRVTHNEEPQSSEPAAKDQDAAATNDDDDQASIIDGTPKTIPLVQYRGFASRLTSKQRSQEAKFLESQIEALELQRDALEDLSSDSDSDTDSAVDRAERPRAIPSTKRVDWHHFKTRNWCDCIAFTTWATETKAHRRPHALEVLVGKARYYWERKTNQWIQDPAGVEGQNPREEHDDVPIGKLPQVPERIRINSRPILAFLANLMDSSGGKRSKVMMRPYKILIRHEQAIRQKYQELAQRWESHTHVAEDQAPTGLDNDSAQSPTTTEQHFHPHSNSSGSDIRSAAKSAAYVEESSAKEGDTPDDETTSGTEAKGEMTTPEQEDKEETPILDSFEAYTDFKCLVNFIDEDIIPITEAYRNRTVTTVRFYDLWHLFKPGDHVLVKDTQVSAHGFYRAAKFPQSVEKNQVYRVFHVTGGRPYLRGSRYDNNFSSPKVSSSFTIGAYRIGFDGTTFGTVHRLFHVSPFKGEKEITSLGVYPLRFDPNSESIESELLASGKKFLELTTPRHLMYRGMTATTKHDGDLCPETARAMEEINGQVMVDFKEARQENLEWITSHSKPQLIEGDDRELDESFENTVWENDNERDEDWVCSHNDDIFDDHTIDKVNSSENVSKNPFLSNYQESPENSDGNNFEEGDLVLLPKTVCAFVLQRRAFALLNIDGLEPVGAQTEGWDDLKLLPGHKEMILAQALSHFRDKGEKGRRRKEGYDLVRGKGQGLIMLLHGFPGVGKTSTAECIAAKIQRPLYPITCGDLGTNVETVDKRLEMIFSKAQKWDCVLLLDEADVFLGERTKDDIHRNAMVSVFLRTLEYYDGLLFLTTNRVGTLDEAFRSRIHATLYYPPLNIEQTLGIWKVNIKRIKEFKKDGVILNKDEILAFASRLWQWIGDNNRTQWNGRQIRNAFQTALAIAEYEHSGDTGAAKQQGPHSQVTLNSKHFEEVARTIVYFDEYLGTAHHGLGPSDRAYARGQRADQYGRPQPPPAPQPYVDDRQRWAPPGPSSNPLFGSDYPPDNSAPQNPRAGFSQFPSGGGDPRYHPGNFGGGNTRDYNAGNAQEGYGGQNQANPFQRDTAPFGFSGASQEGYNDMGSRMPFGNDASQPPKKAPPPF